MMTMAVTPIATTKDLFANTANTKTMTEQPTQADSVGSPGRLALRCCDRSGRHYWCISGKGEITPTTEPSRSRTRSQSEMRGRLWRAR